MLTAVTVPSEVERSNLPHFDATSSSRFPALSAASYIAMSDFV
jgi:hypothetical protein